jgi:hypothetical protein
MMVDTILGFQFNLQCLYFTPIDTNPGEVCMLPVGINKNSRQQMCQSVMESSTIMQWVNVLDDTKALFVKLRAKSVLLMNFLKLYIVDFQKIQCTSQHQI